MTNKEIIQRVNEGFTEGDTEMIISYVADDVRWIMQGGFDIRGKEAFRDEVNKGNFIGKPVINYKTMLEDGNHVITEGDVQCGRLDGSVFKAAFVDIYLLHNGQVKEVRSYVIEKRQKEK